MSPDSLRDSPHFARIARKPCTGLRFLVPSVHVCSNERAASSRTSIPARADSPGRNLVRTSTTDGSWFSPASTAPCSTARCGDSRRRSSWRRWRSLVPGLSVSLRHAVPRAIAAISCLLAAVLGVALLAGAPTATLQWWPGLPGEPFTLAAGRALRAVPAALRARGRRLVRRVTRRTVPNRAHARGSRCTRRSRWRSSRCSRPGTRCCSWWRGRA